MKTDACRGSRGYAGSPVVRLHADHPVPGMTSHTTISGVSGVPINYGTLLLSVKYLLGNDPLPVP